MTTKLPTLRQAIDSLDDKLVELLNERARLVQEVGAIKAQLKQPFYVPERERQILERLQQANTGPFPTEALRPVFSEIISACLSLEHPLRVAFLGPEATFTHMAARTRFGLSARYVPAATVAGVFTEVEKGMADLGVVPIENSTEGVVNSTLDVLIDSELSITAEIATEVSHCLLTRSGTLDGIGKVYSHPQALAQCRGWLSANLPNVAQIEVASTALAARLTRDDPVAAAVASELAGQLYDLKIARKKIEDEVRNVTRFLVVGREPPPPTGRDKTSILFSLKDAAGVLYKVLQPLADAGLNLSRIESRPSRKKLWDYVFFIDVDGHTGEPGVEAALRALEARCEFVKVLGSYPRAGTPEE
ncbi:MAG TPA: prephenate dehydratase [Polyangia bacterium]|nr:prephenate dehydratase [Polyangia bacterium]